MNSNYCKKFGDIFWTTEHSTNNIYKGGKEEDLLVLDSIKFKKNKILADIGGGNGYFSNYIKNNFNFRKVINVEVNKALCEVSLKNYTNIITINTNVIDLELKNKIDIIIFFNSFFYLPDNDYEKCFSNLKKLLKYDGIILINKHSSDKKRSYSSFQILKIKLSNIKKYLFSKNFNFFIALHYMFSKFDFNFERSEKLFLSALEKNGLEENFNPQNNFITIKNK